MPRGTGLARSVMPDKAGRGMGDQLDRSLETTIKACLYLKKNGESLRVSSEIVGDTMRLMFERISLASGWRKAKGDQSRRG